MSVPLHTPKLPLTTPLSPFGVQLTLPPGTLWSDLDPAELDALVLAHRVVVIRGLADWDREEMVAAAMDLGPPQGWRFGAIHELTVEPEADNYLYTNHPVPLHWDGAFADEAPAILIFRCLQASPMSGGQTVFVDTAALCAEADDLQSWDRHIHLSCAEKAHYGGAVVRRMLQRHPDTGETVLRFAEPVDDLNPVTVRLTGSGGPQVIEDLSARLADPRIRLEHTWAPGDCVLADNRVLLHGRRGFADGAARRLWRVNVLRRQRPWWQPLSDAITVRRPEFLPTEAAILLMAPALLVDHITDLAHPVWPVMAAVYLLLVGIGDMANCWADRDVDRVWKTHLAQATGRLGRRGMAGLVGGAALAAILLAVHAWWAWGAAWWVPPGVVIGLLGGAAYSVGPWALKRTGLGQIPGYTLLLAVGPIALISGAFTDTFSPRLLGVATAFGLMQSGVMLLNCAEDLLEDRRHSLHTAAAALGPERVLPIAAGLVAVGAVAAATLVGAPLPVTLAWLVAAGAVTGWLWRLGQRLRGIPAALWDSRVKKAAAWTPHLLAAVAWGTLALVVAG